MNKKLHDAIIECRKLGKIAALTPDKVDAIAEKYSLTDKECWMMLFGIEAEA